MERVAFVVEDTQQRLTCLLNPNTVVMRRVAAVRPQASVSGSFTGTGLSDDPLLYTGGGRTELELDLLFDVSLAEPPLPSGDVRDLTAPIWRLAENAPAGGDGYGRPPLVRFMWGKPWNVLGVVSAVAERLEQFDASGAAGRSWLRLKMIRVPESVAPPPSPAPPLAVTAPGAAPAVTTATPAGFTEEQVYEVLGGGTRPGEEGQPTGELLSTIVARFHPGRPDLYKAVAALNGLDDARWVEPGRLLTIPPLPSIELPASPTMGPPTAAPPSFGSPTIGARP